MTSKRSALEVFLIVIFVGLVGVIIVVILFALVLRITPARSDDRPFDWDRYHARQDACREKDRIAAECVRGVDYCDEPALRQARRACSAFGPLGERR